MSLYQEVRPKTLDEIVGNQVTVGALKKMIRQRPEKRPHAILLKGPSGCGKTTIARILAKEFGSNDLSIIEINAANTRGIETTREIAEQAHLVPMGGKAKTYIFDESHQLTQQAQENLNKIIEDNPSHCYFIFCTTEPQNLIKTIRNRCAEYEVSLLGSRRILELLEKTVEKLSLDINHQILEGISCTCEGSPRAALVALEKVVDEDDVDRALELLVTGTEKDSDVIALGKLLLTSSELRQKNWKKIITTYASIREDDSEKIRRALLTFLFNKLKKTTEVEVAKDIARLLNIFSFSTYYGGKNQLGALVARACFEV